MIFCFCPVSFLLRKPGFRVALGRGLLMWSFEWGPAAMLLIRPFMTPSSRHSPPTGPSPLEKKHIISSALLFLAFHFGEPALLCYRVFHP